MKVEVDVLVSLSVDVKQHLNHVCLSTCLSVSLWLLSILDKKDAIGNVSLCLSVCLSLSPLSLSGYSICLTKGTQSETLVPLPHSRPPSVPPSLSLRFLQHI